MRGTGQTHEYEEKTGQIRTFDPRSTLPSAGFAFFCHSHHDVATQAEHASGPS